MTRTQTRGRSGIFGLIRRSGTRATSGAADTRPVKIYFTKGSAHYFVPDGAGVRII